MGDVLSQNEIDELLKALSTGELDPTDMQTHPSEKKVKPYDFRRPNKFAKDHLRTLQIIFENYARLVSSYLAGSLRTVTHVDVLSAEEVTYHEFNNSLPNPVILSIIDFEPLNGSILLELSSNLGYGIIERILGGKGGSIDKVRGFTEIELILLERIISQLIALLKEPWENVVRIDPRIEKIETNSQFAQIISPNEMVALITLNVKVGEIEGMINICIPHLVIEPVISKLNTKHWFSSQSVIDNNEQYKSTLQSRLQTAEVPLRAVLGETHVSVSDVLQLQTGDVIKLDTHRNSDLTVVVGNLPKFTASAGISKGKIAVQITAVERGEDEIDE